ncbi:A disintegrin and metalloproteinase with thrombospondin motifs adt-1-like [Ostrea edulis]|uniref:A disintegrin and metalloproteinase with thrombospondin motifs adt-1-like n=1 Tax=Ostrea edulis TaxID=37623 RepID=UPI0024AFF7BE|nr:A disintegrin and metalloproteinase with thrombospondin motifs adt-1-like [Ostrea edulis]
MRCYTCSNGKKNSDCTRIETCRKDEESCETKVSRDKAEIKKRCKKSKDCKPTCDKKDKECTMCCTGDLCNKVQGYAEFRSWGSWSSCSKKCGGGKRRRSRVCSFSGNAPCLGDTTEEQDCNRQPCIINQLTCFSCSFSSSNEACNKQRRAQTCHGGQNKCGTRIDRRTKRVLKTCASTCTPSCDLKTCTFCCDTPNCNKEYGTYGPWSKWEMEKVNNVNRLKRTRVCTSKECSGKLTETKDCTPALCKPTVLPTIKPQQFGCYTCSNAKSNDECKRKGGFKTCPTGQDKCGTRVDKRTNKIIKACTNVCKPNCDRNACTYCCTTPGCNNEFGTYGQWSPWKQETRNNVEILVRKRKCLNDICSGKDEETKSCTPTLCKAPAQRCYVCSKAKSNGACSKVETCKKDEEVMRSGVYGDRGRLAISSVVVVLKGGRELVPPPPCRTQPCTTLAAPVTISPNSSQFGCYICNHEKNSDACNRNGIQACPRGQQVCGTRVDRNTKTVMKACTAACKPSCTTKACTFCCSSTGCNKEYGRYGQWSSWKEKKDKGGKKVLVRSRACLSKECSEVSSQTKPCTPALCSGYEQRCYVCNKGKKNSDCSKIETCKKDEHTCETRVEKGRFEITKQCRKEKECKPRCDPKDAFCVSCCTGSLCNKDEGYGKYGNWGIWTPCSKRCGGGRQKRFRRCSSSNMPCDGPSTEERACNTASCVQSSECHRCTNAKNNGDCNKQMKDTCSAYQSCETKINRQTKALTKKCTSTSACKTLCHGNSAICTFCCQGDNCNEGYGEWAPWSAWALKNGKKSRTRTCNTIECSGESTEEENCIGTSCSGVQNFQCRSCSNARSDAECNFGPLVTCPADKHTCQTRVERATGLTSKGCASPSSCTQACTAGSPTCMFCCSGSTCNENYGTWGGWGAWSITGTKGSLMTRKRTCASILCSGEGVETLPCRGPICSQFRCQACNNATSNEDCNRQGFQTCGSNDDTCGTSVTRATSRISKGCKPKGQCRPWCDAVSCTFCCNSAYCNDVYGVWQLWTSWKVVLVNNVYKRQRTRNCVTTLCSGDDKEEEGCTGANCTTAMMPSIDGGFTDWSTWSSCSKTCGGGTSEKSRTCSQPVPQNGGRNCTGSFSDSRDCNTQSCPVDGNWGIWGPWASCSKSCGGGKQHRERKCDDPTPAHGGTNCTGDTMQLDDCNDILCPLPSSGQYVQKCPPGWFTCKSGGITCIDVSFKCDCANDCDDGSDEEIAYASCTISQMQNCNSGTDHIRFSWWILLLSLTLGLMALR